MTGDVRGVNRKRIHVYYAGQVQGVGFRYTVKTVARGYEVVGVVRNLLDGRVELEAEGEAGELESFLVAIRESGVGGHVRQEDVRWEPARGGLRGFEIVG